MSLATKIAAGLCICPVVAAPPVLMHKPTRDKIAKAAGYVPKAQKPAAAPIAVTPEVACVEPAPAAPVVSMGDLARSGPYVPTDVPPIFGPSPFSPPPPGPPPGPNPFPPSPPGGDNPGGVIPGVPEPGTWTIMVVGFGMVGAAVRRTGRTQSAKPQRKEGASA